MKKLIFIAFMAFFATNQMNAQSLFKTVRDSATKVVNDPSSSQEKIDIGQFEITALNYLVAQVTKRGQNKPDIFFDSQAVSMKSFVDDCIYYTLKARKISSAKKKQVLDCYKNASLACPLFKDQDKKTTQVYIRDANTFTPFSLDTDWDSAYELACKNIKSIMK